MIGSSCRIIAIILLGTAPALVGGGGAAGATNVSIIPWAFGNTLATAETNGDYFEWAMTVQPGNTASLSSLDFSLRRSAVAAPDSYAVEASTDGFATAGTTIARAPRRDISR